MKDEYDFSTMKRRRNPYASRLKKAISIRLGEDVLDYFRNMAEETGVPYQTLIDLYLRDCMQRERRIEIDWPERGA